MDDTLTLTELAKIAGVARSVASTWLARGLLPMPLPEAPSLHGMRRRNYRFPREEAMAALEEIQKAREKGKECKQFLKGKNDRGPQ